VRAKPVDRFGWESDQAASAQNGRRFGNAGRVVHQPTSLPAR
jgi:hypothetical protein